MTWRESGPESEGTMEPEAGGAIGGYLARLGGLLSPRATDPAAVDLLDELRDHLLCQVEQEVADGAEADAATDRAVAESGPVDGLASALRAELVRPHLRRLSVALLLLGVGAGATWTGVLLAGPAEPWTERTEPGPIVVFDAGGELAGTATLLAAVLGVLLVVGPGRFPALAGLRAGCQRWSLRACWLSLALGLATAAQLGGYLLVRALIAPSSLAWPAVIAIAALTMAAAPVLLPPLRGLIGPRGLSRPRGLTGPRGR
ncbi:MAG TPA: hypothetical protein VGD73_33085 [Pseudonocardia sp.]|uniref:hypothetical protein n=1 Tax=Pseudonocardia sp. TaxID=60912 RepID=UPI002EDB5C44